MFGCVRDGEPVEIERANHQTKPTRSKGEDRALDGWSKSLWLWLLLSMCVAAQSDTRQIQ
jgi:hypothetical protein